MDHSTSAGFLLSVGVFVAVVIGRRVVGLRRDGSAGGVFHLEDLRANLLRDVGVLLKELATVISPALEWSQQAAAAEVERTVELLKRVHGVTLAK